MSNLEQRLAGLERSNRRMRVGLMALGAGLVGAVLVAADSRPGGRFVADELIIQDETGRPRIVLNGNADNKAVILFHDANGVQRINIGTYDNGIALVAVSGEDGQTRVSTTTKGTADGKVKFMDAYGKSLGVIPAEAGGQ